MCFAMADEFAEYAECPRVQYTSEGMREVLWTSGGCGTQWATPRVGIGAYLCCSTYGAVHEEPEPEALTAY